MRYFELRQGEGISRPMSMIEPARDGNIPGACAEPKAATAAHNNPSPIVGMDTRYYRDENNPHPYSGGSLNQMAPCNTCDSNEEVYMSHANNR